MSITRESIIQAIGQMEDRAIVNGIAFIFFTPLDSRYMRVMKDENLKTVWTDWDTRLMPPTFKRKHTRLFRAV